MWLYQGRAENRKLDRFLEFFHLTRGCRAGMDGMSQLWRRQGQIDRLGDFTVLVNGRGDIHERNGRLHHDKALTDFLHAGGVMTRNWSTDVTSAERLIEQLKGRGERELVIHAWVRRIMDAKWEIEPPSEAYERALADLAEKVSAQQHAAREALIERDFSFGSW